MDAGPADPFAPADDAMAVLAALRHHRGEFTDAEARARLNRAVDTLSEPEARWALRAFIVADACGWRHVEEGLRLLDTLGRGMPAAE